MKVLSYNTLFGGFDGTDRTRHDAQLKFIAEQAPDVLLLQEARGFECDGQALLLATEHRLGMRGFLGLAPHTGQNTAIFLKAGIRALAVETDAVHFHHAKLSVTAQVPGFADPVSFISVHLCPNSANVRLNEVAYLVNEAASNRHSLVGGDFNTISPADAVPSDLADLPDHFRLRYTDVTGRQPDTRPLQFLSSAGWLDLGLQDDDATRVPTVPTAGFEGTEFATFRSDYFLATAPLARRARHYGVLRNSVTDRASDHYSIVVEFDALG